MTCQKAKGTLKQLKRPGVGAHLGKPLAKQSTHQSVRYRNKKLQMLLPLRACPLAPSTRLTSTSNWSNEMPCLVGCRGKWPGMDTKKLRLKLLNLWAFMAVVTSILRQQTGFPWLKLSLSEFHSDARDGNFQLVYRCEPVKKVKEIWQRAWKVATLHHFIYNKYPRTCFKYQVPSIGVRNECFAKLG